MLYRYRLYNADGSEAGEAHYAVLIRPGETTWTSDGPSLRVVSVVPAENDSAEYVGMLRVEEA